MGAWEWFYSKGAEPETGWIGNRYRYGVKAIQEELNYNGIAKRKVVVDGVFGDRTDRLVKRFQDAWDLKVDGVIGQKTAKVLFHKRIEDLQLHFRIPGDFLCGQARHEGGYDPAATGWVDKRDRGIVQYNSHWHPNVSDAMAYTPSIILPYTAQELAHWHDHYLTINPDLRRRAWRCAIAHHNSPRLADRWFEGGLRSISDPDDRERIRKYVVFVEMGC